LLSHLFCESSFAPRPARSSCVASFCGLLLATLLAVAPQFACGQQAGERTGTTIATAPVVPDAPETAVAMNSLPRPNFSLPWDAKLVESDSSDAETGAEPMGSAEMDGGVARKPRVKREVEKEIAYTGLMSYGDHKMFGAAIRCQVWLAGIEYDRHIWGRHLKSQMDYVVEFLPFVLLDEPALADKWGNPKSKFQQLVPGMAISPFGFRNMWRANMKVKPYLIGKAGIVVFTKKALSPNATYENLLVQGEFGLQIKMTNRVELRVSPFEYVHISNAYINGSDPGLDELSAHLGITYHLGKKN